jgi:CheY-like chemotaxis protein
MRSPKNGEQGRVARQSRLGSYTLIAGNLSKILPGTHGLLCLLYVLTMPSRAATTKPRNLPDLSRLTLLVVDDNNDSVDMLAAFLRACGANVLEARTPFRALGYFQTTPRLDAIITDLAMPEMTGVDLLERVRAHPRRSRLPVIALTGYYEDYAQAAGFDAFLRKPVNFDELCSAINRLVRRRKST